MFSRQKFPLEVCERLIGYVDNEEETLLGVYYRSRDSTLTLSSCALVCRDWVPKSRIHLFRDVRVGPITASRFMALVVASPALGVYVQNLYIRVNDSVPRGEGQQSESWMYSFFMVVPPLLPNLLRAEYHSLPVMHPSFYIYPPRFPHITTLFLRHVVTDSLGDILRLIGYHNHLRILGLFSCSWRLSPSAYVYSFAQRWGSSCPLKRLAFSGLSRECRIDLLHWFAKWGPNHWEFESLDIEATGDEREEDSIRHSITLPSIPDPLLESLRLTLDTLKLALDPGMVPADLDIKFVITSEFKFSQIRLRVV